MSVRGVRDGQFYSHSREYSTCCIDDALIPCLSQVVAAINIHFEYEADECFYILPQTSDLWIQESPHNPISPDPHARSIAACGPSFTDDSRYRSGSQVVRIESEPVAGKEFVRIEFEFVDRFVYIDFQVLVVHRGTDREGNVLRPRTELDLLVFCSFSTFW